MKMNRREMIAGVSALAAVPPVRGTLSGSSERTTMTDQYFLSSSNPLATSDQRWLDAKAVELFARADVQQAKERAAGAFARVTDQTVSPEVWGMFRPYVDSFAFRSIQLGVNSDVNYPRVYRTYSPAAKWLGNTVPESKWGQENPDNIYRIIPIGYGGHYAVHGKRHANPPSDVSYTLVADTNTSITVGLLGQADIVADPDGSFVITLDDKPAGGRRNHIQITPDAQYLFIRDSLGDWRQTPNALRAERLNAPTRGPLTIDELAVRAGLVMRDGVAPAYYWSRLVLNSRPGALSQPQGTGPSGGLLTQITSHGWFALNEGEEALISFNPIAASYFSIVLYDIWGRSLEYRDYLTSLNNAQTAPDADGNISFVIAARDPGIHNWLDTTGLHEFSVGLRWQGISPSAKTPPHVSTHVFDGSALADRLPASVRRILPDERAAQLRERQQDHDRRNVET
jgi:hypothetical protein